MLQHFSFTPDDDIASRTRWYINFRWFYVFMLSAPIALSIFFSEGWSQSLVFVLLSAAIGFATNGIFYLVARLFSSPSQLQTLAVVLMVTDISIVDYIIVSLGGVESRSVILYVIPIIMSAVTLGRKGIYTAAALSLVSYNVIFVDYYRRIFHSTEGFVNVPFHSELPQAVYAMTFATTALIAVLLAMDYIIRLLRQKERQALQMVEDLKRAQAVGKFGSWESDVESNTHIWSDEVYHLLGLSPEYDELTIDRYMDLVYPQDRRSLKAAFSRARRRPGHFNMDYRIFFSDNTLRYFHVEGEAIAGQAGTVTTMIGTLRDMTEERALEQSKNEFVSLASHQLRTPATVIKQYLGMLLDGYAGELTDKQRGFLKTAADTNERQIAIVNNLLGVAQLESGKIHLTMAKINLVATLTALIREYEPRAHSKSQTLDFLTRHKELYCLADEYYLHGVFENLVDNALRYTMPGKSITIRLKKEENHAVIFIADQGVGIAEADLPKLFRKFSRIEHPDTFQEEGAGLGLYWALRVVTLHNGKLEVSSHLGRGTTFKITLPLVKKAPRVTSGAKVPPRRRRRIQSRTVTH